MSEEEINRVIAEAIGWEFIPSHDSWNGATPECWKDPEGEIFHNHNPYPDYTRDLNAAITLVDYLAERGWRVRLDNGLDKTWECTFERTATAETHPDNRTPQGLEQHYAPADTLPLAICLAFGAALNLWKL